MADDSFIREVNEELRSDRMKSVWRRFGPLIIGAAVAIVLGTAGTVGYQHWVESKASASGDKFVASLGLAVGVESEQALVALDELAETGYGSCRGLARRRADTVLAEKGDPKAAIAAFDAIAAVNSVHSPLR